MMDCKFCLKIGILSFKSVFIYLFFFLSFFLLKIKSYFIQQKHIKLIKSDSKDVYISYVYIRL